MAVSEPYGDAIDAIVAELVDAAGPLVKPAQIERWVDDAAEGLGPSERLLQALTRTLPHVLVCDAGGDFNTDAGGGPNTHQEVWKIAVYYACGAPGGASEDFSAAQDADGSRTYWGEFALRAYLIATLAQLAVPNMVDGLSPKSRRVIPMEKPGVIAVRFEFETEYLHEY